MTGEGLAVLTYHAVDDCDAVISTSPRRFTQQMTLLAERGIRGITLREAFTHLSENDCFPDHSVVLSFDDGYLSILEQALPIMVVHGFTGTVFVTSGFAGMRASQVAQEHSDFTRDMLGWPQAKQLLQAGWEFGSHTVSHPNLCSLDDQELGRELSDSKAELEQKLKTSVESFAYPYGHVDQRVRDAAANYYKYACTTRLARQLADQDPLLVSRIDMYYMRDLQRFSRLLDGQLNSWLAVRRLLRAIKGAMR